MLFYVSKNPKDKSRWLKVTLDPDRCDNVLDSLADISSWKEIHQLVVEDGERKSVVPIRSDSICDYFEYDGFRYDLKEHLTEYPGFIYDRFSKDTMSFNEFLKILDKYGADKFLFAIPAWALNMFGIKYENGTFPHVLRSNEDFDKTSEFVPEDPDMPVQYCKVVCRLRVPEYESILFSNEFVFEPLFIIDPTRYTFVSQLYESLPLFKMSRVDFAVTLGHTVEIFEHIIDFNSMDTYSTYTDSSINHIRKLNEKFKSWFEEFIKSDEAMDVCYTPIDKCTVGLTFNNALTLGYIQWYDKEEEDTTHKYGGSILEQPEYLGNKVARV